MKLRMGLLSLGVLAALAVTPMAHANPNLWTNGNFATLCVGHGCVSNEFSGSFTSQYLATTAGATYDISFDVQDQGGPTSEFTVWWENTLVADVLNPANNTTASFSYTSLLASSNLTYFEINGRQDPGAIYFTNISVTLAADAPDAPEPASLALLGAGLAGLGVLRRRKRG